MCLPNILFPAFMFAFIFHCHSFSPCWLLAFLIFSPPLWISMFLFLRNSSALFSITHSSSFSVIHVNVNINNNTEKDTTFFFCPDVNYNISNQEYWILHIFSLEHSHLLMWHDHKIHWMLLLGVWLFEFSFLSSEV